MHFEIKALQDEGGVIALALDAASESDALYQAENRGLTVLAIKKKLVTPALFSARRWHFPLVLFSQELLALLDAGPAQR